MKKVAVIVHFAFGKEYLDALSTGGNLIVEAEVVFKGICAECNKKAV